ncbi:Cat31 [Halyomorpha halys]|nr:Cat31 [Halyomorpha halys]
MVAFAAASPAIKEQWSSFKHEKSYQSIQEEQRRMAIFSKTLKTIEEHNAKYEAGLSTYYLEMNHFGDMQLGAVSPVKAQGTCRSCWAFSTVSITGAIEGQYFRKTGKLVSLSEQQLIDCSTHYMNEGCGGGMMDFAFNYLKDVAGLEREDTYPYEAKDHSCRYNKNKVVPGTQVKAYTDIKFKDDEALRAAVATVGPISVAVSSGNTHFLYYKGDTCNPGFLDHGVLLVGYGSDNGEDYWLIKNSFGVSWGEKGFMRLTRSKKNACGISSAASYPILL